MWVTAIIAGKDKTQVRADSIALVIIDIVLSDVVFVCFSELVKRVIVVPI
jgi:hypothetical protein